MTTPLADQLSHTLQRLTDAVQHPEVDDTALIAASDDLAALTPQFSQLEAAERSALEPKLTHLLAQLENAIARLTIARDETGTALRATQNRATAFKAYGKK